MDRYRQIVCAVAILATGLLPLAAGAQQTQSLGVFTEQVLTLHPAIRAVEKELARAMASKRAAGQYPHNPEFEADFEDTAERTTAFGISQTIDVWGRRGARVTAASAEIEISRAEYDLTKTNLLERLLLAVGENEKQSNLLNLAIKRLSLSDQFLRLTQKFREAGDIGQADVLTAEVTKSNAELQVAATAADIAEAQRYLIALTGEKRNAWPKPLDILLSKTEMHKPDLDKTPELRFARAALLVSKAGITIANKDWLPYPTIGVRVGEEGEENLFGFSVSVPLPVWNQGTGEKMAASADAAGKEFTVVDTERRLRARLITAEERFKSAQSAIQRWRNQTLPTLRNQEGLLNQLAEAREIGTLEYLQQLNQLIETESLGIGLEQALWNAWIARLRAGANLIAWVEELK